MNDAAFVGGRHPRAELPRDVHRAILGKAADAAEKRGQVLAVDVLHGEEPPALRLAEVVEAAHVLVRHLASDAQLVVKLRQVFGVGGDAFREELQRDRLLERQVVGAVDLAHAAPAQQGNQSIAPRDDRSGIETSRRPSIEPRCGGSCRARRIAGRSDRRIVAAVAWAVRHGRILLEDV
jgi:hypothetical protein